MDLKALKKTYYEFVDIQNERIGKLGNKFYAEMADAIYLATEKALDPSIDHMHIVPAQTGSGKSTYMQAMVAALCENGYTSTIISKTINQAHESYEIIGELLDEPTGEDFDQLMVDRLSGKETSARKLVIYSSKHRIGSIEFIENQKFTLGKVEGYNRHDKVIAPIVISTHAALLIEIETGEDTGVMRRSEKMRDVIFLDESPEFNMVGMIRKAEIEGIKDEFHHDSYKDESKALTELQDSFQKLIDTSSDDNGQYCTDINLLSPALEKLFIDRHNAQFNLDSKQTSFLEYFDKKGKKQLYTDFIKFLKSLKDGQYFISKNDGRITYSRNLFQDNPAFVLLDATAAIDEFQSLNGLSKESVIESPHVSYEKLQLKYITPPKEYTGSEANYSQSYIVGYKDYILNTILEHSKHGDKILVIARKTGIDRIYKENLINAYHSLNLEGREVHFIYHGSFIGENEWGKIQKLFLFTGYQRPKNLYIGLYSSYQSHVDNKTLKVQSGSRLQGEVMRLLNNEKLKWFKQLAARGNVRNIDKNGRAGEMELYTDTDLLWLIKNISRGFPKAPMIKIFNKGINQVTRSNYKIVLYLESNTRGICSYDEIAKVAGYKSTNQLKRVLDRPELKEALEYIGWHIVNKKDVPDFNGIGLKRLVNWSKYRIDN